MSKSNGRNPENRAKPQGTARVSVNVEERTKKKLKDLARTYGVSMTEMVRLMILYTAREMPTLSVDPKRPVLGKASAPESRNGRNLTLIMNEETNGLAKQLVP